MKRNKLNKALKIEINSKIDEFVGDYIPCEDVEIKCEDKECLLNGILEKINFIVGGNKSFDGELKKKTIFNII